MVVGLWDEPPELVGYSVDAQTEMTSDLPDIQGIADESSGHGQPHPESLFIDEVLFGSQMRAHINRVRGKELIRHSVRLSRLCSINKCEHLETASLCWSE